MTQTTLINVQVFLIQVVFVIKVGQVIQINYLGHSNGNLVNFINLKIVLTFVLSECPSKKLDIILLLDGSGSVKGEFKSLKDWTKTLAKRLLQNHRSDVKLGLIQYSSYIKRLRYLIFDEFQ